MTLTERLFARTRPIEIQPALRATAGLILVVVVLTVWSAWAELEEQVRAIGKIVVSSRSQVIQIVDGGVLARLNVKEGDHVKVGEVIAELQTVRFQASAQEIATKVAGLKATVTRLEAELEGVDPKFDVKLSKEYPDLVTSQRNLYQRRVQLQQEEQAAIARSVLLAEQELDALSALEETGDAALSEVIKIRRQVSELKASAVNKKNSYRQEAQGELAKSRGELEQAQELLTQRTEALNATQIRAPLSGVVNNIKFTTIGAVLKAGDEIMRVVPSDEALLIQAEVSPRDVGFLRAGLPANIKLDAYDYVIYGSLQGTLTYISPDTIEQEYARRDEELKYQVNITVNPESIEKNKKIKELIPGMTATVEIITGRKTVAQYLLKPLLRARSEALTER